MEFEFGPNGSAVKNLPAMQETQEMWDRSLGQEDPLEDLEGGMATHSSILAWRIPWTKEPGRHTVHGVKKSQTQLNWLSTHRVYEFILQQVTSLSKDLERDHCMIFWHKDNPFLRHGRWNFFYWHGRLGRVWKLKLPSCTDYACMSPPLLRFFPIIALALTKEIPEDWEFNWIGLWFVFQKSWHCSYRKKVVFRATTEYFRLPRWH